MLRSSSTGLFKSNEIKINKLPPLTPKIKEKGLNFMNIYRNNKINRQNLMKNDNFNKTELFDKNLSQNFEDIENIKKQKDKILLDIKDLEKRKIEMINSITQLGFKKDKLNKQVNEMNLSLKLLENKKIQLNNEVENIRQNLKESQEEEKNLNQRLTEMKKNYNIYVDKIQDMDNCMGKNIERNFNEINKRKGELNYKEIFLNRKYIEKENELKEKEKAIIKQENIHKKKGLELEDMKKKLVLKKCELGNQSLKFSKELNNLHEKTKDIENYLLSREEQLKKEHDELEKEKEEIKREKENIQKEKEEIVRMKIIIEKNFEEIDKKMNILEQKEKEINQERKQLEKEKMSNNKENERRIQKMLDNIFNGGNQIITEQERISDISFIGSFLKDSIMEEKRVNPNNFIDTKKYIKRDKTILPLYLLSNWLENNGCQVAIEKKPKDVRLNKFCLQQIFSRNAVEKKFTLVFDERYNEHFLNKENRQNFMSSLKMDLSNYLKIPKNEIFIMNPRGPQFTIDLFIKDLNDFKKMMIEKYIRANRKEIIIIKDSILLEGCKLSPAILEPEFDMKPCDWPKNIGYKANIEYYPPYNYMGFGLKVLDTYDYGDNTWIGHCNQEGEFAVAYHGIRSNIGAINQILNSHLKEGVNQAYENHEDIRTGRRCGRGVYVTPRIEIAEQYTKLFYAEELNQYFRIVFQCRVNPRKIRQPRTKPEYWILNGNGQEIRPYRLLVKQENN